MAELKNAHIINDLVVDGNINCDSLNQILNNLDESKQNILPQQTITSATCTSLNNITEAGWYWCNLKDIADIPITSYGVLEVINIDSRLLLQRYTIYNVGVVYVRVYANSQWYDWNTYDSYTTFTPTISLSGATLTRSQCYKHGREITISMFVTGLDTAVTTEHQLGTIPSQYAPAATKHFPASGTATGVHYWAVDTNGRIVIKHGAGNTMIIYGTYLIG